MRTAARLKTHRKVTTQALERTFRERVIAELRNESFHGAVRAFAQRLVERYGPALPFDKSERVERTLTKLNRQGVIQYTKDLKHLYKVVGEIRLAEDAGTEPTARRTPMHIRRLSKEVATRRAMELLATLAHLGGNAESITALEHHAVAMYGDAHQSSSVWRDIAAHGTSRYVLLHKTTAQRPRTVRVELTQRGRNVLQRYRAKHAGSPQPPTFPGGIRTRTVPVPAAEVVAATPNAPSAPVQPRQRRTLIPAKTIAARDAAIDEVLIAHDGSFRGAIPLAKIVAGAYPSIGTTRAIEYHIQQRIANGTLSVNTGSRAQGKIMTIFIGSRATEATHPEPTIAPTVTAPAMAPVAPAPPAPVVPPTNGAATQPPQSDLATMLADVDRRLHAIAQEREVLDARRQQLNERQQQLEAQRQRILDLITQRDALVADLRA